MPKLGVTTLIGKSGEPYTFNVYAGNMRFNDFIPGVYYISRQTNKEEELSIYLGYPTNSTQEGIRIEKREKFF